MTWRATLEPVVQPELPVKVEVDTLIPHDLLPVDVLAQKAPETFRQYQDAIERKFAGAIKRAAAASG